MSKYNFNRLLEPGVEFIEFPFEDANRVRASLSLWCKKHVVQVRTHRRDRPEGQVLEIKRVINRARL